jgi:hypothetical protein
MILIIWIITFVGRIEKIRIKESGIRNRIIRKDQDASEDCTVFENRRILFARNRMEFLFNFSISGIGRIQGCPGSVKVYWFPEQKFQRFLKHNAEDFRTKGSQKGPIRTHF